MVILCYLCHEEPFAQAEWATHLYQVSYLQVLEDKIMLTLQFRILHRRIAKGIMLFSFFFLRKWSFSEQDSVLSKVSVPSHTFFLTKSYSSISYCVLLTVHLQSSLFLIQMITDWSLNLSLIGSIFVSRQVVTSYLHLFYLCTSVQILTSSQLIFMS